MSKIKIGFRVGSPECTKEYNATNSSNHSIDHKTRLAILYAYNKKVIEYLIDTGEPFKIPSGIGTIRICRSKPVRKKVLDSKGNEMYTLRINPWATNKAGKRVYFLNLHTEGYYASFRWFPNKHTFLYPDIWKINMFRDHTRLLAKTLKEIPGKIHDYRDYSTHSKIQKQLIS